MKCGYNYIIIYYTIQVNETKKKEVEAFENICLLTLQKNCCLVFSITRKINRMCSFSERLTAFQTCFYRFPYVLI